ncbi:MAG: hypothetical protein IJW05_05030 [Lentisphaeria bacterium]|nr:hypothetical protein [Lentisphaeria bacterium]
MKKTNQDVPGEGIKFPQMKWEGSVPRPSWWKVHPDEIIAQCTSVRRGYSEVIARTPGGYPVYAVFYGTFDDEPPLTNWSAGHSSSGWNNYYNRQNLPQTILLCAGIHGAEAESVAGAVNLIQALETGYDFRGKTAGLLPELLEKYRLILVPCVNMDGRAVSPDHLNGAGAEDFRAASQGRWNDGALIGWQGSKSWFPLPLDRVLHPGGYPNADGYNIMHDACPGNIRTAEARALLQLAERYRVDLVLNSHSCEGHPHILPPGEMDFPENRERAEGICNAVHRVLYRKGFIPAEIPGKRPLSRAVNLNTLFTLASGALGLTFECTVFQNYSFDQLLEQNYVVWQTVLEEGLLQPFTDRKQ